MARPRKHGKRTRTGNRRSRAKDAVASDDRGTPNDRIAALRKLFSFVQPPADKRQDGRNGEIDSEVCDAVGQLAALGFLHEPRP
jgi:hypothetical protein